MTLRDRLRRLVRLGLAVAHELESVAPLLTRVVLGWAFLRTGFGKWQNFDETVAFFGDVGIPLPLGSAALVATLELVGGGLLILGLRTRLCAALLVATMAVAIATADREVFLAGLTPGSDVGVTDVVPLNFLLFLMWLVAFGAGGLSLDRLLRDAKPVDRPRGPQPWYRRLGWAMEGFADRLQAVAPLLTRLAVGYAFVRTGLGKWQNFESTVGFFADLGIPLPEANAALATGLELVGGALLMLGLGTRLFATLLAVTMVVALATAEKAKLVEAAVPGGEIWLLEVAPLVLLMFLTWLAVRGPGKLSLDRVLYGILTARKRARAASAEEPIRIVVLGGGFGGIYAAMELEKTFDDDPDVRVTLVNKDNFFLFTPMLHEVAASDLDLTHVVSPIRQLLRRADFFNGEVVGVDFDRREVVVSHGGEGEHPHRLRYDHLVLGLGAVTNFWGLPGLEERALTMKTLGDAIELRNRVISGMEEADGECAADVRRRALAFVVAGGGFAGVETMAAINDFARESRRFYPSLEPEDLRMVLVHSGDTLLPELSKKLGRYAQEKLAERGVEIRLKTRVKALTPEGVELSDGTIVPARTLVWTAGTAPNPILETFPLPKEKGRVVVSEYLEVPGCPGVWALGDCARVPDVRGGFCPPTAQHASRQGKVLARNIAATIRGGRKKPFTFKMLGQLAALGRRSGVASILGMSFSGFWAWWLWRSIYLLKLPNFERKLRVALDWSLDLFFHKDLVKLPTERGPAAQSRPAEEPAREPRAAAG
jgi:NADH dehydrogenase